MTTLENRPSTALLVVDVQNGVVEGAHERDAVVTNVGSLVERARRERVPVVWVQHSDGVNPVASLAGSRGRVASRSARRTSRSKRWCRSRGLSGGWDRDGVGGLRGIAGPCILPEGHRPLPGGHGVRRGDYASTGRAACVSAGGRRVSEVAAVPPKPKSIDAQALREITGLMPVDELDRTALTDPARALAYLESRAAGQSVVLLDVGGYFAPSLAHVCTQFSGRIVGVVEDTENGHQRYEALGKLPCPVFSVARSPLEMADRAAIQ
ncbi:MAG: isochorismatase family protein [Pseudonocardia sp.]